MKPPYPKPPIAEALIELNFSGGLPWAQSEKPLLAAFAKEFSGQRRALNNYEVRADWRTGELSADGSTEFSRWLLPSDDGTRLVGVAADVLSVHVLAPYPGWARFRPMIDRAFATYAKVSSPRRRCPSDFLHNRRRWIRFRSAPKRLIVNTMFVRSSPSCRVR